MHRLRERLALSAYEKAAPLSETVPAVSEVRIPLSQHIGAPAVCAVQQGDRVEKGQVIGRAADGLSVSIHSSISGVVERANEKEILIREVK